MTEAELMREALSKLELEIANNERGLRGPVHGQDYWKGRLNGLHRAHALMAKLEERLLRE